MRVARGGGKANRPIPPTTPTPKKTLTATVDEVAPRLRVGVPGKSYVPPKAEPRNVQRVRESAPVVDDGWADAVAADGDAQGLARHGPGPVGWVCRYGCAGGMSSIGLAYHHYACPYWEREGKNDQPF